MKLINKTKWDTKRLRSLVKEICKTSGLDEPSTCEFANSKSTCFHGLGVLGGSWIEIFIPTKRYVSGSNGTGEFKPMQYFTGKDVSDLIIHELRHNTGLKHKEMLDSQPNTVDNLEGIDLGRVNGMIVLEKTIKPKLVVDLKEKRYQRVLKQIKIKESKLKRVQNQLKKLYQKKKYYEVNKK